MKLRRASRSDSVGGSKPQTETERRWGTASPEIVSVIDQGLRSDGWLARGATEELASFQWIRQLSATLAVELFLRPGTGKTGVNLSTQIAFTSTYVQEVINSLKLWECWRNVFAKPESSAVLVLGARQEWLAWNESPSRYMPQLEWTPDATAEIYSAWLSQHVRNGRPFIESHSSPRLLADALVRPERFVKRVAGNGPSAPAPLRDAVLLYLEAGMESETRAALESYRDFCFNAGSHPNAIDSAACEYRRIARHLTSFTSARAD